MPLTNNWFALAFISAFFFGVQTILTKVVLERGLSSSLITTYFFSITSVFLWIYIFITQRVILPHTSVFWLLLLIGIVALISNLTLFKSYQLADNPGYVRAISSLGILIVFVLALFTFDLKFNVMSGLGILLITVGTIILSLYA